MAKVTSKLPPVKTALTYAKAAGFMAPTKHSAGFVYHLADATEDWCKMVEGFLYSIPAPIRTLLAANDVKIVLAGTPVDIGYTSHEPNENDFYKRSQVEIGAFYSPTILSVVLPEEHLDQRTQCWIHLQQPEQVIAHEIAHALDDVLKITEAPEAKDAYALDKAALTGYWQNNGKYGYLLQDSPRGNQEALAEHGSLIWTGDTVCGLVDWEWPCFSLYSKAYIKHVEENYDHSQGLSQEFKSAAAKAGEHAVLKHLIARDNVGHDIAFNIASRFKNQSNYFSSHLIPSKEYAKRVTVKNIFDRQGHDVVEAEFHAHRLWARSQPRFGMF